LTPLPVSAISKIQNSDDLIEKLTDVLLRVERGNPIHNRIKHLEIAASLTLLAMNAGIEFFPKLKSIGPARIRIPHFVL
jgi:hypothetical protein